jgi:transcriptional regulator with XRE-family HTH domain
MTGRTPGDHPDAGVPLTGRGTRVLEQPRNAVVTPPAKTVVAAYRWGGGDRYGGPMADPVPLRGWRPRPLLRTLLGDALRRHRLDQRRTLADVATKARVSVPYLSEVERGRKEASSEVLAAVCDALRIELSDLLAEAGRECSPAAPQTRASQERASQARVPQTRAPQARAQVIGLEAARRRHDRAVPTRRPGDVVLLAA